MNRKRIYAIIEKGVTHTLMSRVYEDFMLLMIIISLVPLLFNKQRPLFIWFDRISVIAFIIDYILRWITADMKHPEKKPIKAFLTYPFSFIAITDLLSILPSIGVFNRAFKVFRLFRLLKLLRVLRILRYTPRIEMLLFVFKKEKAVLLSVLGIAVFYIFVTALLMFNVENSCKASGCSIVFNSFLDALYWATTTLTTVGYGDICPVSDFGRIVSMVSSLFGLAIIALPSGVITASYMEEIKKSNNNSSNEKNS